jgi:hypothetical protein
VKIDWNAFGGMELGSNKQDLLRDHRSASYAYNTKLWDGSITMFRKPKKVASCTGPFISDDECIECVTGCAQRTGGPCGSENTYHLVDGFLHKGGKKVGVNRPTEVPVLSSVVGKGDADSVIFRVLCLNDEGEYSAPSAVTQSANPAYGDAVQIKWSGCRPYRVQALLRQSMEPVKALGKIATQWVTVGDFESPTATFSFEPNYWQLTDDGFDPNLMCDPPELCCFTVTDDGYWVGWNGSTLYISDRHDPSKWIRSAIKNMGAKILDVVSARSALYIGTSRGMFVARIETAEQGPVVSIAKTYENNTPISGTLSLINSGAMYATQFGVFALDEAGRQPQNISAQFMNEDEYEQNFLPISAVAQRGVFYANQKDKSWLYDFPGTSGGQGEFGRLVYTDKLGDNLYAAPSGFLQYSGAQGTYEFDRGEGYLGGVWESVTKTEPIRSAMSRYKVSGENLGDVVLTIYADGREVFSSPVVADTICTLPLCAVGTTWRIKLTIPPKKERVVVNRVQLATSVAEILR